MNCVERNEVKFAKHLGHLSASDVAKQERRRVFGCACLPTTSMVLRDKLETSDVCLCEQFFSLFIQHRAEPSGVSERRTSEAHRITRCLSLSRCTRSI